MCKFLSFSCGCKFSALLGNYQREQLPDHMVRACWALCKACRTELQSGCTTSCSCQQWMRVPDTPHLCQQLVLSGFWILAILIGMQNCCFNLHFPDDMWSIFFLCHVYIFFGESIHQMCVYLMIGSFIFLLLSFKSYFCIFDNGLLSYVSFANVFFLPILNGQLWGFFN